MSNIEDNTKFLIQAAEKGDAAEVQRLIPLSDPKTYNSQALHRSAYYGHADCVQLLIPVSDPCDILKWAARFGHAECVDLLIPVSHPEVCNGALIEAAAEGHVECVKRLIPVSNPKAHNSQALLRAAWSGHIQCIELLYPISEPQVALEQLQHHYPDHHSFWWHLSKMVESERLQGVLTNAVGEPANVRKHKM